MNVRNLLTLNAVLIALVGLISIFAPATFPELIGHEITDSLIGTERAFGAVIIGNAVISWLLRGQQPSRARKTVLLGFGINYIVFAGVNIYNILIVPVPVTNLVLPWAIFGLNVLLGLGFLYFWRQEPES